MGATQDQQHGPWSLPNAQPSQNSRRTTDLEAAGPRRALLHERGHADAGGAGVFLDEGHELGPVLFCVNGLRFGMGWDGGRSFCNTQRVARRFP